ncbi:hypothetical protein [Mycolicibacterium houstonense]|uniref:hypothetical protein n=1 Tax=Mycolicibacterium houstonense TaxID=146021 RepID=UPI00135BF235|nr:hypothetical protein [Mycolicibacterium houstonense]
MKAAAQRRLQQAADALTTRLIGFALDQGVPDAIALQAVKDALDRAGLSPKTAVEVDVALKPYERILNNLPKLQGGSRAEFRRAHGIADDSDQQNPALAAGNADEPIDVEIVSHSDQQNYAYPMTPSHDDWQPDEATGPGIDCYDGQPNPFGESDPPLDGLMTLDEAVIRAARIHNRGVAGHARVLRAQRALPPGKGGR